MYGASSPVVVLTPDNFKQKVKAAGIMFVEFYAPWCGHCKQLTPEYEKTAKALKGMVAVGAVDADAHPSLGSDYGTVHQSVCSEFGVSGYPTIKYFGKNKNKDQGAPFDQPRVFSPEAKQCVGPTVGEKFKTGRRIKLIHVAPWPQQPTAIPSATFGGNGGGSVAPIQGSVEQLSSITAWDGKDGVLEEADEFSLDDLFGDDEEEVKAETDKTEL
eukprot:gene22966-30154_t